MVNNERDMDKDNAWVNDPDVQDFLERADEQGPWPEEYDKVHTVGGLTNDPKGGFMKFQKKQDYLKGNLD
tara:strand:- start:1174 stop:1383 length:210 start_codon:yes stop_codon:yes gene_type:complete